MKAAKIISLIGAFFYLLFWLYFLFISLRVGGVYSDMNIGYNPTLLMILGNLVILGFVVANAGFYYYLDRKERKGEKVSNAIIFSILIAVLPLLLYPLVVAFSVFLPIYNITSNF